MTIDTSSYCDDENDSSIVSGIDFSSRHPGQQGNDDADGGPSSVQAAAREERRKLALKETRAVQALRLLTLVVLLAAATLCSYAIYQLTSKSQDESFELEYYAQANKVIESFHTSVEEFLGSFDALSSSITSYARDSGSTFPNVTVSDFEVRGANTRILAQGTFVQYMPLVTDETRKGWEAYATASQGYLFPTFMSEQQLKTLQDVRYGYAEIVTPGENDAGAASPTNTPEANNGSRQLQLESVQQTFRDQIWGTSGNGETEAEGTGPYLPIWQSSPTLPLINLLNMNTLDLSFFNGPYKQALDYGQASLGVMTHLDDPTDENGEAIKVLNALLSFGQYRHDFEEYSRDPITSIAYPVFDSFTPDRKVVGILGSALYWRLLFKNVLPDSGNDIMDVVVHNSFEQAETYRLNGPDVSFVGEGDLHDPSFDDMEQTANIADYLASMAGPDSRSYTAVDLNPNYVSYDIRIFPTGEMEAQFVNDDPFYYALGAAAIFFFTAVVFVFYNCLVERRQKVILDTAVRSSAVVDSLFPANIKKRLYEETQDGTKKSSTTRAGSSSKNDHSKKSSPDHSKKKEWNNNAETEGRLTKFLSSSKLVVGPDHCSKSSKPIADSFPESSVFFADLVGFTKWSSTRTPSEVFELLEGIYGSFDRIAARRQVFKIETIGDCYVAVTGVPEPQINHAVLMAKFSCECLEKLGRIVLRVAGKFGDDTLQLNMRIGIHSGPVTAGVLRGERARFQLFGDTVNTAARMESTGVAGKVQCSEATAKYLRQANRGSWLKAREETIHAKGKGELQTYWIEATTSSSTTARAKTNETASNDESQRGTPPPSVKSLQSPS